MMNFRVWINGSEVSDSVIREDLPEYLETSVRGPGFFEFRVEPFRFRVLSEVAPEIGQSCRVDIGGETWLDGVIDSIADAFTNTPEVEAVPFGAALKDVKAGQEAVGPDGKYRWVFELTSAATLQSAVESLLSRFNLNKPASMAAVNWQVSVEGSTDTFFDDYVAYGLTRNVKSGEVGDVWITHELARWYDNGLTPPPATTRIQVRHSGTNSWLGVYRVMGYAPAVERVSVWRFADTGVTGENAAGWSGYYTPESWESDFGSIVTTASAYLTSAQVEEFVSDPNQANNEFVTCFAKQDTDSGTWTWCKFIDNEDGRIYVWAVWWASPLDQTVQGRFYNRSMGELLQVFALISGRWVKIEGDTVTLIARSSQANALALPDESQAVEFDQQKKQLTPPRVDVPIWYGGSDEGLGGGWNPSRVAALDRFYSNGFSGIETETEAVYLTDELPAGLQLLSKDASLGTVLGLDRSLNGKLTRARIVAEGE